MSMQNPKSLSFLGLKVVKSTDFEVLVAHFRTNGIQVDGKNIYQSRHEKTGFLHI